jgi:hypothetical protein
MNAGPIPDLLSIVMLTWLGGVVLMLVWLGLSGRMWVTGLFTSDLNGDGIADEFHPERVQLLFVTLLGIGSYAYMTFKAATASDAALTALPDVSEELLMLMGASQTMFLSGKYGRTLKRG